MISEDYIALIPLNWRLNSDQNMAQTNDDRQSSLPCILYPQLKSMIGDFNRSICGFPPKNKAFIENFGNNSATTIPLFFSFLIEYKIFFNWEKNGIFSVTILNEPSLIIILILYFSVIVIDTFRLHKIVKISNIYIYIYILWVIIRRHRRLYFA